MKPEARFLNQPKAFWANIRTLGESIGYTVRGTGQIKIPSPGEVRSALESAGLEHAHVVNDDDTATALGDTLLDYFAHRADQLNNHVQHNLMDLDRVKQVFEEIHTRVCPKCPIPKNKQKGGKSGPAYFTGVINMLIEEHSEGLPCDFGPRKLTKITLDGQPLRTLARQVDGAFPGVVDPIAVWEIKEYYNTKTFGSRVADGVYETLLDGMELEELRTSERIDVKHYLMVDSRFTWWQCGRSYLCRIVDMLHMGYVDEVFFGYEVVDALPGTIKEWVSLARERQQTTH